MTDDDGKIREIYVPKELGDDNLFDQGITSGINFFQSAGLRQILVDNILKSGYRVPTPVQKRTIPIVMAGRDVMACAQTGSGKTAAFLLPIIHKLIEEQADAKAGAACQEPQCVVITPTRELAIQIKDEARKFSQGSMVKAVVAYGGTSVGFQLSTLVRGCNILICTPGRMLDFVDKGKVSFASLKYLVLDEADRMLDMGFMPDIQRCFSNPSMPKKEDRQTLMFSATFPDEVQRSAAEFLNTDYLFLTVGVVGGACSDVKQAFFEVPKFEKREKLKTVLEEGSPKDMTLVFVKTKKNADFIASFLSGEGFPATSIHGDRLQREREEALRDFKTGRMPVLVATAVAARGLDIKGVAHVINYDLPKTIDEYVHRIGRTGRVGNTGKATSFFDPTENAEIAGDLVQILSDCQQEVPDYLKDAGGAGGGLAGGGGFGGVDIRGGQNAQMNAADDDW